MTTQTQTDLLTLEEQKIVREWVQQIENGTAELISHEDFWNNMIQYINNKMKSYA